jgi:hypothetical protein
MMRSGPSGALGQWLLDVALIVWTAAWVFMGVTVGHEVRGLGELGGTVNRLGSAVTEVGGVLGELPLIGGELAGAADQITQAGREAVASADTARASARRVGVLLGMSIALIPSSPVLLLYLPRRMALRRERRALKQALAAGRTAELDRLLAERAVIHLPYSRLRRVSADPYRDLRDGRYTALADAELERFRVMPPRTPTPERMAR